MKFKLSYHDITRNFKEGEVLTYGIDGEGRYRGTTKLHLNKDCPVLHKKKSGPMLQKDLHRIIIIDNYPLKLLEGTNLVCKRCSK